MRHFIFVLSMVGAFILLTGCMTVENLRELPIDAKLGCYHKELGLSGSFTHTSYATGAVFCTENLPENYNYEFSDGRTKVSIGDAN